MILLQIIKSISPKASVENLSAQWAIFYRDMKKYIVTLSIHCLKHIENQCLILNVLS